MTTVTIYVAKLSYYYTIYGIVSLIVLIRLFQYHIRHKGLYKALLMISQGPGLIPSFPLFLILSCLNIA